MNQTLPLSHTDILPDILPPLLQWYPAQADNRQLPWRESPSPYHTWLSEIMLQQTRASAVIPYYERFLDALPDIPALAAADETLLMKLWQGLGYYSRARNLQKAARIIMDRHHGKLPQDQSALQNLPGIGPYTAGAIGAIAWGKPWPAVDGNVLRIVSRVLASSADIASARTRRAVTDALSPLYPSGSSAGALNQAFMDLGATICLPHGAPHCPRCPLAALCLAHEAGREQDFPVKKAARPRRVEQYTVLLLRQGNTYALHQRPKKGLLAGLWEFPNLPGKAARQQIRKYLRQYGLTADSLVPLPEARHIFSHVEWKLSGWLICLAAPCCIVADSSLPLRWVTPQEIAKTYSVPAAFSHYLPYLYHPTTKSMK